MNDFLVRPIEACVARRVSPSRSLVLGKESRQCLLSPDSCQRQRLMSWGNSISGRPDHRRRMAESQCPWQSRARPVHWPSSQTLSLLGVRTASTPVVHILLRLEGTVISACTLGRSPLQPRRLQRATSLTLSLRGWFAAANTSKRTIKVDLSEPPISLVRLDCKRTCQEPVSLESPFTYLQLTRRMPFSGR